ncbi:PREDICTED: TBC1 domain family member 13 isoform X3 [Nelumbo nucifera]|uniref:TBC1 domain family member 13 isoform X3 n=1 Tax=Nelumbo nucifera TaxID=4432 RepID=A0A1U8B3W9_NELNU|nr:PREDICTED: TBC1 domain family member 13 isoform X3 [Nelumbo nucifera]
MMKARVPEWLNSTLWSSKSPPVDERLHQCSPKSSTPTISAAEPPRVEPPLPQPPPKLIIQEPSTPQMTDPRGDDHRNSPSSLTEDISRQTQLLAELSKKTIDMHELRRLASQGIPDGVGIRPTIWKSEVTRRIEKSAGIENNESCEGSGLLPRSEITHGEHPLSLGKTSIWNQFFQDTEIIEQIDRDVRRTHPDMHFFSGDSSFANSNQEALRNILILFAKLNPGIRYVQGMNEVLAPLFYVFKNDSDEKNAASAEADAFFCFVELLSGFRDHFCQQLDNSVVGIRSTITKLSQLLKEHDEELWRHLEVTSKVNPQFYAFRWITLLLTQEFNFADSLHIWDTLLSDPEGPQDTLLRICCAMLILIRRRLLAGDFTSNLKLLQNYPSTNISHLLYVADKLRVKSTR